MKVNIQPPRKFLNMFSIQAGVCDVWLLWHWFKCTRKCKCIWTSVWYIVTPIHHHMWWDIGAASTRHWNETMENIGICANKNKTRKHFFLFFIVYIHFNPDRGTQISSEYDFFKPRRDLYPRIFRLIA